MKNKKMKKAIKYRVRRLTFAIIVLAVIAWAVIDFCKYPECYLSTWRYQLQKEVEQGDSTAIAYYENVYVKNNRDLWED